MTFRVIDRDDCGLPPSDAPQADLRAAVTFHYSTGEELGVTDTADWWRRIWRYHVDGRGWSDIAYHYGVDRYGRIYQGRPMDRRGAHAGTSDGNLTVGVCFLGDDDLDYRDVTPEARAALCWIVDQLDHKFGQQVAIYGHRDWKSTGCPGDELYGMLPLLRSRSWHAPLIRTLEQAVVGASDVDVEHGRVLAASRRWALVRVSEDRRLTDTATGDEVQVRHGIRIGRAVQVDADYHSTTDLAGPGRDDTAVAVAYACQDHPVGTEHRRGAPW